VLWTQAGEAPERMLLSRVDLSGDWYSWKEASPIEVLRPEGHWEGAEALLVPSVRSTAYGQVNQLRDPAVFEEDGHAYPLYAVAGESGSRSPKFCWMNSIVRSARDLPWLSRRPASRRPFAGC